MNNSNRNVGCSFGLIVIAGLLASCGKSSSFGSSGSGVLNPSAGVNMAGTNAMYVAPGGTSVSKAGKILNRMKSNLSMTAFAQFDSSNALYAVSASGTLAPINITSGSANVSGIINSPNFTILQTSNIKDSSGLSCGLVLIRNSDSDLFCVNANVSFFSDFYKAVQTDSTGNYLVYQDVNGNLNRLNLTNPANIIETQIAQASSSSYIQGFAVNAAGDTLANFIAWDSTINGFNIEKATLVLYPLSGSSSTIVSNKEVGTITSNVAANDNNFYYTTSPSTCGSAYCKLVKSGSNFTAQAAGFTFPMCMPGENCNLTWVGSTMVVMAPPGAGLNWFFTSAGSITVSGAGVIGSVHQIDSIAGANGVVVLKAENTTGQNALYAYNIAGNSFTTLLTFGSYSISSFSMDSIGNTTVSGTRASDGAIVMGTIAAGTATLTIVSQSLSAPVVQVANLH